uniref:Uncharacterized protein n=1 Tax=Anguilla anguilla TaxID=7936 RepID=A0A0E9V431_ANGAN
MVMSVFSATPLAHRPFLVRVEFPFTIFLFLVIT